MNKPLLDTTLCVYGMDWSDKATVVVILVLFPCNHDG